MVEGMEITMNNNSERIQRLTTISLFRTWYRFVYSTPTADPYVRLPTILGLLVSEVRGSVRASNRNIPFLRMGILGVLV